MIEMVVVFTVGLLLGRYVWPRTEIRAVLEKTS
jgi:hypothetical protein